LLDFSFGLFIVDGVNVAHFVSAVCRATSRSHSSYQCVSCVGWGTSFIVSVQLYSFYSVLPLWCVAFTIVWLCSSVICV